MRTWRVEIERKTVDVVVVEADHAEEAVVKGQSNIYQIRTKAFVTATATEKLREGEKSIAAVYD
jgi:hypothetical protein